MLPTGNFCKHPPLLASATRELPELREQPGREPPAPGGGEVDAVVPQADTVHVTAVVRAVGRRASSEVDDRDAWMPGGDLTQQRVEPVHAGGVVLGPPPAIG